MRVEIPWPPVELSPNYKNTYWTAKQSAKEKYRNDCFYVTRATNITFGKTINIPLKITFHPKTKRFPDLDNCLSWAKYGLDSVAKAWGVNDKQFRPITLDFGDSVKNGKIIIEADA